ncbi:MAG: hypothetical protein KGL92_01565 [Gammaproteobacteria bacterium]|nr:hypothetical protein [Gammaproteobacteria bacterium]MDE2347166.1 hypothetical protein [Gammaproteobacteria bacterium]
MTAIHRLVDRCRTGELPTLVAKLTSGWVVLGERQVITGYCLLLPDPVVPHLNALAPAPRSLFLAEMARLGDALLEVTDAVRLNYAMFGNAEPALHAHVFPRHRNEPPAIRALQPWALDWDGAPVYSEALHGDLRRRLRSALEG